MWLTKEQVLYGTKLSVCPEHSGLMDTCTCRYLGWSCLICGMAQIILSLFVIRYRAWNFRDCRRELHRSGVL